jgi:hypothetical protein
MKLYFSIHITEKENVCDCGSSNVRLMERVDDDDIRDLMHVRR